MEMISLVPSPYFHSDYWLGEIPSEWTSKWKYIGTGMRLASQLGILYYTEDVFPEGSAEFVEFLILVRPCVAQHQCMQTGLWVSTCSMAILQTALAQT